MLKHVHYLHIPTDRWTLFSGKAHSLSQAPHHMCEGFTYVSRRVSRKSPPFIHQHHHHAGSGQPVSSWDAIQSLMLNTVEQRFCFADKMLSSQEVLLLRGLPVSQDFAELPYLLPGPHPHRKVLRSKAAQTHAGHPQQCPGTTKHAREKKTAVWIPQDPFGL